jgi:hypothetical protein
MRAVVPVALDQAPKSDASGAPQAQQPDPTLPGAKGSGSDSSAEKQISWQTQSENVVFTVPGNPALFKSVTEKIAIVVQVTPFEAQDGKSVTLVVQCQVWIQPAGATRLSYRTAFDTVSVAYGGTVFVFPLGIDAAGKSPLRLDIAVLHAADYVKAQGEKPAEKSGK